MKRPYRFVSQLLGRSRLVPKKAAHSLRAARQKLRLLEKLEARQLMTVSQWSYPVAASLNSVPSEATVLTSTEYTILPTHPPKVVNFATTTPRSDGSPDESFSKDGKTQTNFSGSDFAKSVAIDATGRTIVVGNGGEDFAVARYLADGKLDRSFGKEGKVRINFAGVDTANDVVILKDGRILVVGGANNEQDFGMAMLKADGSLDKSFGVGGRVLTNFSGTDYAEAVAIDNAGRIIVVGNGGRYR